MPGRHITDHQMRWGGSRPPQTASQCAKLVVLRPLSGKDNSRDQGYDDRGGSGKSCFLTARRIANGAPKFRKKLSRHGFAELDFVQNRAHIIHVSEG
jgi:hypothetical protein